MSTAVPARLALIAASADRRTRDRADLRAAESWARTLTALLAYDRAPPRRAGGSAAYRTRAAARVQRRPLCVVCRREPDTEPARGAYRTPEGEWFCRWHWRRAVEAVG